MFTGLVEEVGVCERVERTDHGMRLAVCGERVVHGTCVGESIAVNGCCLTVTSNKDGILVFDMLAETVRRTNLGDLSAGSPVNLERALAADGRIGGHFVQGHIDETARVLSILEEKSDLRLEFSLPPDCAAYVAFKGSIAINGVSLTVAELCGDGFVVWLIPHTRKVTNLGALLLNDRVNLETDILAKYAERILAGRREDA